MIKINITEELIKILPLVQIQTENLDDEPTVHGEGYMVGVKMNDPFYLSDVIPNIIYSWGLQDRGKIIGGELEFPADLVEKAWNTFEYLNYNIQDILSILLYTSDKGGIKPGLYKSKNKTPGIWEYVENE